jgi:pteridine reductase
MAETPVPLALVTGAARRIGRVFALSLARMGYAILLHYNHSSAEAEAALAEIRAMGVPVSPFQADLSDPQSIEALFSFVDSLPNPLRILVNSAAVMPRTDIHTLSAEQWDSAMAINLRAPFLLAQQASARMKAGSLIINITDAGVSKTWTGFPAYSVSKAGLVMLTRILAKSLGPEIRVNSIAPGLVLPSETVSPQEWQKLIDRLPSKRATTPEELALALEFLVKNESLTGQTIVVDGGYSLI